jgi:hypothetical protein
MTFIALSISAMIVSNLINFLNTSSRVKFTPYPLTTSKHLGVTIMKTSKLIFGLAFSVLASSTFALPAFAENGSAHTHAIHVAADGSDHVGANRVAADGADRVGANRVAADGADHVGANRVAADGSDHVGANRVAADGADHVGASRLS